MPDPEELLDDLMHDDITPEDALEQIAIGLSQL